MKNLMLAAGLAATLAWGGDAQASTGQITGFGASATTVAAGTVVDFTVDFALSASGWSTGGSNLDEPAPMEGYQTWNLNWYSTVSETIPALWLEAAGNTFNDFPNVPVNSGHSGTWTFSVLFPTPGTFDITLGGGWNTAIESYHSNENAWRDCFNNDPGGTNELWCSSWNYVYDDGGDTSSTTDSFGTQTLKIEVSAVPEPAAFELLLAGALVMAMARRRKR